MLRKLHDLIGYTIEGLDESIGSVDDFYFDDNSWTVRYLIVDTGPWLVGRRVLISTEAVTGIDSLPENVTLNLTKEQIENSPSIHNEQPVSREHEVMLHEYYGWPGYWTVSPLVGMPMASPTMAAAPVGAIPPAAGTSVTETTADAPSRQGRSESQLERDIESNLRSVREVTGYNLHATDDEIGHVEDIFAGENDWIIRYFLIDTRNWWPGKKVLIARDWVEGIDWADRAMRVSVTRKQVKESPEYNPRVPLERDYEHSLYNHYQIPGYWL